MKQKSMILQILYGQRGIADTIKTSDNHPDNSDKVDVLYCKFRNQLENQSEIWQSFCEYLNALEDLHSDEAEAYYAEGFKLGLLLGIEAGESKYEE